MHARRLKAKVLVGSCCLLQFTIFCSLMRRLYTAHCTSILFVKWIATHKGNSPQRYKRMLYIHHLFKFEPRRCCRHLLESNLWLKALLIAYGCSTITTRFISFCCPARESNKTRRVAESGMEAVAVAYFHITIFIAS